MNKFNNVTELLNFVENQRRIDPKVNLDKMQGFCNILGNPEKSFKSIHITGTNGKGSVVTYLKSIFMKHGLNVATFTSPYIECFNERITYNKQFIPDELIIKYTNEIISKLDKEKSNQIKTSSNDDNTFVSNGDGYRYWKQQREFIDNTIALTKDKYAWDDIEQQLNETTILDENEKALLKDVCRVYMIINNKDVYYKTDDDRENLKTKINFQRKLNTEFI